mmetsp:Transcript_32868/g.68916  ORF Transcript_32868/g.68916 Transcript_32868/m.68916 type:complete len:177 (-) Transcript_32868:244-774(-)|eukprot:CAMPEP_0182800168 /NCGR_PEP_ID=MMETSP0006_2-20121128/2266_1 /TAXON_ID=97485 /ORGANISM="Prymnesium parvum, Strain Texoma1" /LENGTH=176 /DNA_ID=CAMNT_0024925387 /DNA_START=293 /DNA_END=823 /DNA_ORIENTATION=-
MRGARLVAIQFAIFSVASRALLGTYPTSTQDVVLVNVKAHVELVATAPVVIAPIAAPIVVVVTAAVIGIVAAIAATVIVIVTATIVVVIAAVTPTVVTTATVVIVVAAVSVVAAPAPAARRFGLATLEAGGLGAKDTCAAAGTCPVTRTFTTPPAERVTSTPLVPRHHYLGTDLAT